MKKTNTTIIICIYSTLTQRIPPNHLRQSGADFEPAERRYRLRLDARAQSASWWSDVTISTYAFARRVPAPLRVRPSARFRPKSWNGRVYCWGTATADPLNEPLFVMNQTVLHKPNTATTPSRRPRSSTRENARLRQSRRDASGHHCDQAGTPIVIDQLGTEAPESDTRPGKALCARN